MSVGVTSDPDYIALIQLANPSDPSNLYLFYRFFEKYGAFFISSITFGGTLYYWAVIDKTFGFDKTTAKVELEAEYKAVITSAKAEASAEWEKVEITWKNNRKTLVKVTGNADIPNPSSGDNFNDIYNVWTQNIVDGVAIGYTVEPISILFSGDLADAMNTAIGAYAGTNMQLKCLQANSQGEPQGSTLSVAGVQIPSWQIIKACGGVQAAVIDRLTGQVKNTYNDQLTMKDTHGWWTPVPDSMDRLFSFFKPFSGNSELILAINFWGVDGYSTKITQEIYAFLTSIGAGKGLDHWFGNFGESLPEGNNINYSIVGISGMLKGQALESWSVGYDSSDLPFFPPTYLGVYLVPKSVSSGKILLYPV
jgi:MAC/Perforin domain